MGSSSRRAVLALVVALAWAPDAGAQFEDAGATKSFEDLVRDRISVSGELLAVATEISPIEGVINPNNGILKIEDYQRTGELRFKIEYRDVENGIKLRVEPWAVVESEGFTGRGQDESEFDIVVGRYLASWHDIVPRTTLSAHRSVVAWGPGFLLSPSNPFPIPSSTENPLTEQEGGDFWHVSTAPTDNLSLVLYHNYQKGAGEDSSIDPFQEAWAFVANYFGFSYSGGLVLANKDDDGYMAGLYGQWTASESVVLFLDAAYRERERGFYPQLDASLPNLGTFVNKTDHQPEVLVGGSYTTPEDTTFYAEYLYYGAGYTSRQLEQGRLIQQRSASIITTIPALGAGTLGLAASAILDYRARHVLGFTVSKSIGPFDLQAQNAWTPQDYSGRVFASATYSYDRFKLALSAFHTYGGEATAFRQDENSQVSLAALVRF